MRRKITFTERTDTPIMLAVWVAVKSSAKHLTSLRNLASLSLKLRKYRFTSAITAL